MTKQDDKYWTQIAKEKEMADMSYDDKSPHMVHPSAEPIRHANSVFDTLSALSDTVLRIADLEQQKQKLISQYQEQMQAAENGFHSVLNPPERPEYDTAPERKFGF